MTTWSFLYFSRVWKRQWVKTQIKTPRTGRYVAIAPGITCFPVASSHAVTFAELYIQVVWSTAGKIAPTKNSRYSGSGHSSLRSCKRTYTFYIAPSLHQKSCINILCNIFALWTIEYYRTIKVLSNRARLASNRHGHISWTWSTQFPLHYRRHCQGLCRCLLSKCCDRRL